MRKLSIDFLLSTPVEKLVENIDSFFKKLLQELESYLNLEPINYKIEISIKQEEVVENKFQSDVFSIGVDRFIENNVLKLHFYISFLKFFPILLLREAYKCFIPFEASRMKIIEIFINQKVLIDLETLNSIEKWNSFILNKLVDYEFISHEYNRLDNFLKQESSEKVDSPFIYFFKYIRRNISIISEEDPNFYDAFFKEYMMVSSKSLFNDEIVETIRVLNKIFNEVQYYTALLDYQQYFREYKDKGFIQTDLSLNKFTENMQWIKQFSTLSPSYRINWPALNISSINCYLKFNPILNKSKINQIFEELPFFVLLRESRYSFAYEMDGFFVIPNQYDTDLKNFLKSLEENGYVLKIEFTHSKKHETFVNLNYFREYHNRKTIVNKEHKVYEDKYELRNFFDYANQGHKSKLTMLDWLIIDRIRYYSQTGFNFERRAGTLKLLKSDLMNEVISQRKFITNLKSNLLVIHSSSELRNNFLEFISKNESFGFFYIKKALSKYIIIFNLIKEILSNNSSIHNVQEFFEHIKKHGVSYSIENNLSFNDKLIKKTILTHFLPLYFKSKEEFDKEIKKFGYFLKIINSFYDLKIFNLQSIRMIVQNESLINTIFKSKEKKLNKSYESYELSDITYQLVEEKLDNFLKDVPPVIKPDLTITIPSIMTPFFVILLRNNVDTVEKLKKVSYIAQRMEIISNDQLYVGLLIPHINSEEKHTLISILSNLFENNLLNVKRYIWSGHQRAFSRKDFYDLEQKEFFYTHDLFRQYFLNVKALLGEVQKPISEAKSIHHNIFWSNRNDLNYLIKLIDNRIRIENIDFRSTELRFLLDFHNNLDKILQNLDEYKIAQQQYFFKNYINSIDFVPSFQHFGISQYFLYFYPTHINQVDFKLLLNNSFQLISYPAQIDNSNSFLCQYLFPYRNPGVSSYLNWLTKSKKIIREYCLFFIKKIFQILHFNYNLNPDGWDLDPNRFKMYFQNILFNPEYNVQIPYLKEFNIGDLNSSKYLGPNSPEFKALSQIYNWKPIDIKSYITRRYFKIISSFASLLKKGLISPYISLKNLDIVDEITIILPAVKKELNEIIQNIFSFFNIGFVYEMEGEYYIHGFEDVIKFENGIMIKLFFPDCQIDEFEKLFDLLFEYMEIDYYLILHDLVEGKALLKNTFQSLKFLDTYNPLTNLIWNDKDKRWRNHKLFDENFKPVYPDLFYGKNTYKLT
ncbi:MAG: hypothetical protein EAX91_03200 [Candidatus Lokiarchaeota archaeon]|nr:hypothetical protein [Candidatus Lokiarchaeota archaeon]